MACAGGVLLERRTFLSFDAFPNMETPHSWYWMRNMFSAQRIWLTFSKEFELTIPSLAPLAARFFKSAEVPGNNLVSRMRLAMSPRISLAIIGTFQNGTPSIF